MSRVKAAKRQKLEDENSLVIRQRKFDQFKTNFEERRSVLEKVQECGDALSEVPEKYKDDKEIVLMAVASVSRDDESEALKYASPRLRNDREVVLLAISYYFGAIEFASVELIADRQFILDAVCIDGDILSVRPVEEKWRDDRQLFLEAVKQDGCNLCYASKRLKGDRGIASAAINQNKKAFEYASRKLRSDRNLAWLAIKKAGWNLRFCTPKVRANRQIVLAAVKSSPEALKYASEDLRADTNVVLEAVGKSTLALEYASNELRGDRRVVAAAVKNSAIALSYASQALKNDPSIVALAIREGSYYGLIFQDGFGNMVKKLDPIGKAIKTELGGGFIRWIKSIEATPSSQAANDLVCSFAERTWRRNARETVWLVKQVMPEGVVLELQKLILEFADVAMRFRWANDLTRLAPVYVARTVLPKKTAWYADLNN